MISGGQEAYYLSLFSWTESGIRIIRKIDRLSWVPSANSLFVAASIAQGFGLTADISSCSHNDVKGLTVTARDGGGVVKKKKDEESKGDRREEDVKVSVRNCLRNNEVTR